MGANELSELLTTLSGDACPLSGSEWRTLLRVVGGLEEPGQRVVAALYRQAVGRATGQHAPEPVRKLCDYADLIEELAEYLPGESVSAHPIVECCALLAEWFPDAAGMDDLGQVVRAHAADRKRPVVADPSAIVLLEPGHPRAHFLLTVWCYYGPDNVEVAYRGPEAMHLERLRDVLRTELADAMDRMASRLYQVPGVDGPARVEFIVPVELMGEPVEDWPIGADEPGEERIGWCYPVVLRDLGRSRQPRLHARWRRGWHQMSPSTDFTWYGCDANPDRDPAERLFAGRCGPVAFTGPPLSGHRRELLGAGLKAGVPAMLWPREDCVPTDAGCDCGEVVQLVEATMAGTPTATLPAHVQVIRMNGHGRWHRLALLWDDPTRWPEPPTRFADPTRRGGR